MGVLIDVTRARVGRWLVVTSFGLLLATWAFTTPPGGFPDEVDHYVRDVAVGRGELYGEPNPQVQDRTLATVVPHDCCGPHSPSAFRWVISGVRFVDIPAALAPEHLTCVVARHRSVPPCAPGFPTKGSISHHTTVGTLEPLPYVVAGLATRLTSDADRALLFARLANALLSLGLLAMAVQAAWPRRPDNPLAAGGLVLAVSPMVLFVGASPSPSALEITAGAAFFAVLLQVVRQEGRAERRTWVALALSGAVLATSRSLGPIWVLADAITAVALVSIGRTLRLLRHGGRAVGAAVGIVAAAGLSTALWEATRQPKVPFDIGFFHNQLYPSLLQVGRAGQQVIGRFGLVDIPLPIAATLAWIAGLVVLGGVVLLRASLREAIVLLGQVLLLAGVTVTVTAGVMRQNGFDIQGRHVLALAVTIPLLAGEIVRRHEGPGPPAVGFGLAVGLAAMAGAVQVAGLVRAGHAYGWITDHPPRHAWVPAGGAGLWVAVAVVGGLLLPVGVAVATPHTRD